MSKRMSLFCLALCVCLLAVSGAYSQAAPVQTATPQTVPAPTAAQTTSTPPASQTADAPKLTAEQIVKKNIEARGGLAAWRAVQSMTMSGKMEAGGRTNMQLPFTMTMKRPLKSRLEVEFRGETAVQVYDGQNGWKLRPYLGRTEAEPFNADEKDKVSEQQELDGPLIDYAAKGTKVEQAGVETVEGRAAYKLTLTFKNGHVRHLWIDAQTFLEAKIEGVPRILDGKPHRVEIYYRDYRSLEGVLLPYVFETAVDGVKDTHKMIVEKVVLNPPVDDVAFAKPQYTGRTIPAMGQRENRVLTKPSPVPMPRSPVRPN